VRPLIRFSSFLVAASIILAVFTQFAVAQEQFPSEAYVGNPSTYPSVLSSRDLNVKPNTLTLAICPDKRVLEIDPNGRKLAEWKYGSFLATEIIDVAKNGFTSYMTSDGRVLQVEERRSCN
jgi:hypothetical protein